MLWPHYPNKNVFTERHNPLYDKSTCLRAMEDCFHSPGPIDTPIVTLSLLIKNLGQFLLYSNGSFLAHSSHSDHWPNSLFLTLPITLTSRGTPLIISKSLCLQRLLSRKPGTSCIIESIRLNCIISSSLTLTFFQGLIYIQLKSGYLICRVFTILSDRDPFLSQFHRHGIICRLTFDGSPPSPPSRDISRPICLWLHIPVRLPRPSFNYHLRNMLLDCLITGTIMW